MKKFLISISMVLILAMTACGGSKKEKEPENNGEKQQIISATTTVSATDGGTIVTEDSTAKIEIPAGAIDEDTEITMTLFEKKSFPDEDKLVSKVITFEPSGLVFNKDVTITLTIDSTLTAVPANMAVVPAFLAGTKWSHREAGGDPIMGGNPIMAGDPIMMNAGHFSSYAFILVEVQPSGDNADTEPVEEPDTDSSDTDTSAEEKPVEDPQAPYTLSCTGQEKCYDADNKPLEECGTDTESGYFGQDAQHTDTCAERSFSIGGTDTNKTNIDNNTGLEWPTQYYGTQVVFEDAVAYCEKLNYGGHDDWRLPEIQELVTIIDFDFYYNINDSVFPDFPPKDAFWSNTVYPSSSNSHFGINLTPGSGLAASYYTNTAEHYTICVRGEVFRKGTIVFEEEQIDGGIVVTDTASGLQWAKSRVAGKKWLEALEYCENLTYGGQTDWRLPNIYEIMSIIDYTKKKPATVFPDMDNVELWSSTSKAQSKETTSSGNAWRVSTQTGRSTTVTKTSTQTATMCVRGGK